MSELVAQFQRLLDESEDDIRGRGTHMLLAALEPRVAELLRLCAVPHVFNVTILQVLVPEMSSEEAALRCAELTTLSVVMPSSSGWSVHDKTRSELFAEWLAPDRQHAFAAASGRLAAHFERLLARTTGTSDAALESLQRRHMYHALGADQAEGFRRFEELCRRARGHLRWTECAALIQLVHDYDPVLSPERRARLMYHEAKLAADQREHARAETLFEQILREARSPADLRASALLRLGQVLARQGAWRPAIMRLKEARGVAEQARLGPSLLARIAYELGSAFLGGGELDESQQSLMLSIELARACDASATLATAYNGLGTLHLQRRESAKAIEHFEAALDYLHRAEDLVRKAQVYNNLGLAHAELGQWCESDVFLAKSLDLKRQGCDTLGEAHALTGLARVRVGQGKIEEAIAHTQRAVQLFEAGNDQADAAVAMHNLGKFYRRLKHVQDAHEWYTKALDSFAQLPGRRRDVAAVRAELNALGVRVGLPWWAWASIAITVLVTVLIVLGLIARIVEKSH